ncbi:MAG TPA: CDP-glycerol--glycerophosphate glycerophosphotransferase, partial [Oceanospirillales bacterium]|nr:CDP-glycerol--glycerophosphate glycerophosphotransferase [Oceanospirillales bacterium]
MQFIRHIQAVMRYMGLPAAQRRLTFYCEGINYWPHLEGLLKQILATSDTPVCYITSDAKDPGLSNQHKNLQTFKINEGFIRNYLFEN